MSNSVKKIYHNVENGYLDVQGLTAGPALLNNELVIETKQKRRSSINMLLSSGLGESVLKEETPHIIRAVSLMNKENLPPAVQRQFCKDCWPGRHNNGQSSGTSVILQPVARALFSPILQTPQHTEKGSANNNMDSSHPAAELDPADVTLYPPHTYYSHNTPEQTMKNNMNATVIRARLTPTISSHIQPINIPAAEAQEDKNKLLAYILSKNRNEKRKSEQKEDNDSPLSRRLQALVRMRYLILNSSYLIKKHVNPTQVLAVQQELITSGKQLVQGLVRSTNG